MKNERMDSLFTSDNREAIREDENI